MPLYEFKCRSCDHAFESRIGVAAPFPKCEACDGEVKKVFHPTPIIFKGNGWHVTDYGRNGTQSDKSSASETSDQAASPSETKPKSEAAEKTETSTKP